MADPRRDPLKAIMLKRALRLDQLQVVEAISSIPGWYKAPLSFDAPLFNGIEAVGKWTISGEFGEALDRQKPPTKEGAKIKTKGKDAAEVHFEAEIVEEEWPDLLRLHADVFYPAAGQEKKPVSVAHPLCAMFNLTTIYVEKIKMPTLRLGVLHYSFKAVQFQLKLVDSQGIKKTAPPPLKTAFDVPNFVMKGVGLQGPYNDNTVLQPAAPSENPKASAPRKR